MNSGIIEGQFASLDRGKWIHAIVETRNEIVGKDISFAQIEPLHIVTLSCLIDSAKIRNAKVWLKIENKNLNDFVLNDIRITSYWRDPEIPVFS